VLYGSPDLELCIHECRATVVDNLLVGKLVVNYTKPLFVLKPFLFRIIDQNIGVVLQIGSFTFFSFAVMEIE